MTAELLDRRILAGVRFVDAVTGLPVPRTLRVVAPGVRWIRNRSGDYVVAAAPGLEAHTAAFTAPPALPPVGSVVVMLTVEDPAGAYLPRRASLALPRDPDPAAGDQPGSLFRPVEIPVFPAPAAPVAASWAVVRVTVLGDDPEARLPRAMLRVVRQSDGVVLNRGLADGRGEALIAVAGIPVTTFSTDEGPVLATEIAARVEVIASPTPGEPSDPDLLDTQPVLKSAPVQLASGRTLHLSV